QAINRAHRLGQKEPGFVTRFVTPSTIEGRIAEVLERKRQLFNELIERNGPPPSLGLSEDDVFGLFATRARSRRAAGWRVADCSFFARHACCTIPLADATEPSADQGWLPPARGDGRTRPASRRAPPAVREEDGMYRGHVAAAGFGARPW